MVAVDGDQPHRSHVCRSTMGQARPCGLPDISYTPGISGPHAWNQRCRPVPYVLQSHKWWHQCLTLVLDSSLQNGYILYREDVSQVGLPLYTRQLWHYNLARGLVAPFTRVNIPCGPRHNNLGRQGFHHSQRNADARWKCIVCQHRTRQFCGACGGRFMCAGTCYIRVHTQPGYAALAIN
jgi:hypothetical protein